MRLFEAIVNANHHALAGDRSVGLHSDEFRDSLPLVALTCIDARLNHLFPKVLGIREEDFIWLRNAGNIIFDPMSSMTRTLALACAVKGGREIAIIGHTDCRVRATSVTDLIEKFRALGIHRSQLPDNLVEFFGLFASERQNVINAVTFVRQSPLIGPRIPVHGLLVDIQTGRLESIVNGYQALETALAQLTKSDPAKTINASAGPSSAEEPAIPETAGLDPLKVVTEKIGQGIADARKWLGHVQVISEGDAAGERPVKASKGIPASIPAPPPLRRGWRDGPGHGTKQS
jgi:carbonic anhydrase